MGMPNRGGRPTIFPNKIHRFQGFLTDLGWAAFESHRAELERIAGRPAGDGDVVEALARGPEAVALALEGREK